MTLANRRNRLRIDRPPRHHLARHDDRLLRPPRLTASDPRQRRLQSFGSARFRVTPLHTAPFAVLPKDSGEERSRLRRPCRRPPGSDTKGHQLTISLLARDPHPALEAARQATSELRRFANQSIFNAIDSYGTQIDRIHRFLCECGDLRCQDTVEMTAREYKLWSSSSRPVLAHVEPAESNGVNAGA